MSDSFPGSPSSPPVVSGTLLGLGLPVLGIILIGFVFLGTVHLNQYKFSAVYPAAVLVASGASVVLFRRYGNWISSGENLRTIVTIYVFLLTVLTAVNLFGIVSGLTPLVAWSLFTLCVVPVAVMIPFSLLGRYLPRIRPDVNVFLCALFTAVIMYAAFSEANVYSESGLLQAVMNGGFVLAGSFAVYLFMSGVGFLSGAISQQEG